MKMLICQSCGLDESDVREVVDLQSQFVTTQMPTGTLTLCTDCAELPHCRVCGCTDELACPEGCWWVTDPDQRGELCSSCLPAVVPAALDQEIPA